MPSEKATGPLGDKQAATAGRTWTAGTRPKLAFRYLLKDKPVPRLLEHRAAAETKRREATEDFKAVRAEGKDQKPEAKARTGKRIFP